MLENLREIRSWYETGVTTELIQDNFCSTRSAFNGRLWSYENLLSKSFDTDCLYLLLSSIGEIGNNCFDHNLGFWQDDPGCIFIREENYCIIADRGRGIKDSLSNVYTLAPHEDSYISIAFEKVITGRTPEKRGNGLKFAKKNVLKCGLRLYCISDSEMLEVGGEMFEKYSFLLKPLMKNSGTFTLLSW